MSDLVGEAAQAIFEALRGISGEEAEKIGLQSVAAGWGVRKLPRRATGLYDGKREPGQGSVERWPWHDMESMHVSAKNRNTAKCSGNNRGYRITQSKQPDGTYILTRGERIV